VYVLDKTGGAARTNFGLSDGDADHLVLIFSGANAVSGLYAVKVCETVPAPVPVGK
jgi:hypothetical protein